MNKFHTITEGDLLEHYLKTLHRGKSGLLVYFNGDPCDGVLWQRLLEDVKKYGFTPTDKRLWSDKERWKGIPIVVIPHFVFFQIDKRAATKLYNAYVRDQDEDFHFEMSVVDKGVVTDPYFRRVWRFPDLSETP